MDPWDVDISFISEKFIEVIGAMKKLDLRIPAKMILAAAILLRIKSTKLVNEDIDALDQLLAASDEEQVEGLFDEEVDDTTKQLEIPNLIPRTPQMRKRKVSIYDLVYALEKALEVKNRRVMSRMQDTDITIPTKSKDISTILKNVYIRIKGYFSSTKQRKMQFSYLVGSGSKEDKVYTFIPLIFLAHQRRIHLRQELPFSEIEIYLRSQHEASRELEEELKEHEEEQQKIEKERRKRKKQVKAGESQSLDHQETKEVAP